MTRPSASEIAEALREMQRDKELTKLRQTGREDRGMNAKKPTPRNLTLLDLTERTCKWPVNDGGPFLFCGCEKPIEHSYCSYHAHLSVGPGTESERAAHRVKGLV